jgi:lipid-binding SYLF domain-containing protein
MKVKMLAVVAALATPLAAQAQGLGGWDPTEVQKAEQSAAAFLEADEGLQVFFDQAYAYAVYPSIGKAAFIVGGAHGKGIVFRGGSAIGQTEMTQATVGLQLGGQSYSELIFFQNEDSFNRFTEGNFELAAQASAVAVKQGASAGVAYDAGVAVFTMTRGGAMVEASVGGQAFKYKPKDQG